MTYPHVATVQRMTKTGTKYAYGSAGTTTCFLQPLDAETAQLYSIVSTKASACYLPYTADVLVADRLVIDGVTYGVKGLRTHNYGNLKHKYAYLEAAS